MTMWLVSTSGTVSTRLHQNRVRNIGDVVAVSGVTAVLLVIGVLLVMVGGRRLVGHRDVRRVLVLALHLIVSHRGSLIVEYGCYHTPLPYRYVKRRCPPPRPLPAASATR